MKRDWKFNQWAAAFQLFISVAKLDKTSAFCQNWFSNKRKTPRLSLKELLRAQFWKHTKILRVWTLSRWSFRKESWSQELFWFWGPPTPKLSNSRMTKVIYFKRVSQVTLFKLLAFRLYPKQVKSFTKSRTKRKPSLSWTKRRKNNWKKSSKRLEANQKIKSSEPKLQKWNAEKSRPFAEDSAKNGFLITRKHKASFCKKLKDSRA